MVNENILIKLDQNNLIHIDPNSVLNNGIISERHIKQENLVIYVNLEADLIPRTKLISETNNLISIASGVLSVSQNNDNNTSWTDTYVNNKMIDNTNQSFGINDITIVSTGFNSIPKITINFIDVRGKTLFENPNNSPYKAFFHLPWPIYYLTIKGFYGKAIRYKLHLEKFNTKYNDTNGNFEINTRFIGSTYAFMSDIPLRGIMNAPYLFGSENTLTIKTVNGESKKIITKTSRGLNLLKSVFNEYKQKGLIDKDVPVKTLRELGKLSEALDNKIDRGEFSEIIDPKILSSLTLLNTLFEEYDKYIHFWKEKNLSNTDKFNTGLRFKIKSESNINLINDTNNESLLTIINTYQEKINEIIKIDKTVKNSKIKNLSLKNNFKNINSYYGINDSDKNDIYVYFDLFLNHFNLNRTNFYNEQLRIEKDFEDELNRTNFYKNIFGFKPTLRNLFGILMANADVYIKILKDTHEKAFNVSEERKNILKTYSNESYGENIFPWPEIKKIDSKNNTNIISYPGEKDLINKLNSDSKRLWPEVAFVEEYLSVTTNVYDNNNNKENGVNDLNVNINNDNEYNYIAINQLTASKLNKTYETKIQKNVLYELWERLYYLNLLENFDNNILNIIINNEFENLYDAIKNNKEIVDLFKNIKNLDAYNRKLFEISKYDDFNYKKDLIPITQYINESLTKPFNLSYYNDNEVDIIQDNEVFNNEFRKYKAKEYRKNIYPFSSDVYKSYLENKKYGNEELKVYNNIQRLNKNSFLSSPINPMSWINQNYKNNIFIQDNENILNTSYFHYQLYSDFLNNKNYKGSAYLLLTSLPFLDLDDKISFNKDNPILMSTLFKEISMEHNIPYYLILKWGAIYHRYKMKLLNDKDILEPIISNDLLKLVDNNEMFDNYQEKTFNIIDKTVKFSNKNNLGVHPYYDAIFSQIINGYTHYNLLETSTYNDNIIKGIIKTKKNTINDLTFWFNIVDNKLINSSDNYITILPSIVFNSDNHLKQYDDLNQTDYRIIINDKKFNNDIKNNKFPSANEYFKSLNNTSKINLEYKKIYDLIATFNYTILDEFEKLFLEFSNNSSNNNLEFNSFQKLLKGLVTLNVNESSNDILFNKIGNLQINNIKNISKKINSNEYLIKLNIFNSKELEPYSIKNYLENRNNLPKFNENQINKNNLNKLKLYVGECPNIVNYYLDFFKFSNIELNEENIKNFKTLILIYADLRNKNIITNDFFDDYIKTNLLDNKNFIYCMNNIITKFRNLNYEDVLDETINILDGYNNRDLKIEMYNYFKSFNDQWISGNSIGQKLLMEECLFLDKANREIGDKVFLNISRFKDLLDDKNINLNLYSTLSLLIQGTGFDMRALPSYFNFYDNKNEQDSDIANMLFGTFLDVDYQDTSPKLIFQYSGISSKYPSDMVENNKYFFNDDSFDMNETHNNPLIITDIKNIDFNKSNRVVSFEVNIGDTNQNIFKSVSLDQSSFKNTTESHIVTENIARSNSGANSFNVDTSLFQIYRQQSYTCEVTCIGNIMIQPTMYFYLNNIPMFKGSYLITEVTHSIKDNNMVTSFKGVRMSKKSLPNPEDSFMSSYKSLFDRIIKKNVIKQ